MFGTRSLFSKSKKIHETADQLLGDYLRMSSDNLTSQPRVEVQNQLQGAAVYFFLQRIYQQAKQVSQIIAYIWRWIDDSDLHKRNCAEFLNYYFSKPTEKDGEIGGNLKKLLAADPRENSFQPSYEVWLLREVFPDYNDNQDLLFPIFNKFELGEENEGFGYILNVDINSFQGNLSDTTINHPSLFVHSIPYPPRPELGPATVTKDELEEWIKNRISDQYYAENTYIPTTST